MQTHQPSVGWSGRRTLLMTCITPLVLRMSQSVIVASFTWKINQILLKGYKIKFSRRIFSLKKEEGERRGE
jgi:hypothetical protein